MSLSDKFRQALDKPNPTIELREVTLKLRSEGIDKATIMAELEQFRREVDETKEDIILEVMDFLSGWSSSHMKID